MVITMLFDNKWFTMAFVGKKNATTINSNSLFEAGKTHLLLCRQVKEDYERKQQVSSKLSDSDSSHIESGRV